MFPKRRKSIVAIHLIIYLAIVLDPVRHMNEDKVDFNLVITTSYVA